MSISIFDNKVQQPSTDEIETMLGSALPLWNKLIQFIEDNYQMIGDLSYGGKNYGWNMWYRKSGKSLLSIYPQKDHFVAQVVLGKQEVEKALDLELGEHVGRMVRDTPQLHDGKWLFIPVSTEMDEADIEKLLLMKKKPAKQKN